MQDNSIHTQPAGSSGHTSLAAWKAAATVVLDVRPALAAGDEPLAKILATAEGIQRGKSLALIAPFEPVPLYTVLGRRGFSHATEHVARDEWFVQFTRDA